MKVEKPEFFSGGSYLAGCKHCPFADETGMLQGEAMSDLCADWEETHESRCPDNPEEYAEACALADKVAKEAQSE